MRKCVTAFILPLCLLHDKVMKTSFESDYILPAILATRRLPASLLGDQHTCVKGSQIDSGGMHYFYAWFWTVYAIWMQSGKFIEAIFHSVCLSTCMFNLPNHCMNFDKMRYGWSKLKPGFVHFWSSPPYSQYRLFNVQIVAWSFQIPQNRHTNNTCI
jgi:hypothetical protein